MAQVEEFTGRISGGFDGHLVDKETGEEKSLPPQITIVREDTFEIVKIKVTPTQYGTLISRIGEVVQCRGVVEKLPSPAVYQGSVSLPAAAGKK